MLDRTQYATRIKTALSTFPIVAILGPRQCGKTTLARQLAANLGTTPVTHFDLESPVDLAKLENPQLVLSNLTGWVIIDEIQRRPDLFPVLRYLVDQPNLSLKFLILGSASHELIQQSSESLAGRIQYIELTPFSPNEYEDTQQLWVRGGYPRSLLAQTEEESWEWRLAYIRTYLEQDIPNLGFKIPSHHIRRAWEMMTHYHGQTVNYSELGRSLDLSDTTLKRYLDLLSGTFMIRTLHPWHANIKKRQVKAPKLYFRDSGLFHSLSGIASHHQLITHPKLGASWEGFALETVIRSLNVEPHNCYFWGVHQQGELDLLIKGPNGLEGFEFKYSDSPKFTRSMKTAKTLLELNSLTIVTPHDDEWTLDDGVTVKGLSRFI